MGIHKELLPSTSVVSPSSKYDKSQLWDEGQGDKRGWAAETTDGTTSTVEISISCRNLGEGKDSEKCPINPICVVYHWPTGLENWTEFTRTEIAEKQVNPKFSAKMIVDYFFERTQSFRFQMYHMESSTSRLTPENSLGFLDLPLGQIVKAGSGGYAGELIGQKVSRSDIDEETESKKAQIILIASELACEKGEICLKLGGNSIGFLFGCLPSISYYTISKLMYHDEKYVVVHQSGPTRGLNPIWEDLTIPCRSLTNGDMDRIIKIDVYQNIFYKGSIFCGSTYTTLNKIMKQDPIDKIPLVKPTGKKTKSSIRFLSCTITASNTFVDYLQSAMQIHCCFAIDFTSSNGHPEDPQSFHYLSSNSKNLYEQAIQAVGNILMDYDTSNLLPTFGFGAKLPESDQVSFNFPLTLSDSPNCGSIQGVLNAYRDCMKKIQLDDPSNLAPVIQTVADMASKSECGDNYYILAIITHGTIADLEQTKKVIVEASELPVSIVIIGVGDADFDEAGVMAELDGDCNRVSYKGKMAERDIVQFVPYRSAGHWQTNTGEDTMNEDQNGENKRIVKILVKSDTKSSTDDDQLVVELEDKRERAQRLLDQSQLAQEVLAEIPDQVTSYMKARGILPSMIKPSKIHCA